MERAEKICFWNTHEFWGGGEKLHLEYAIALRDLGHPVCVVAHDRGALSRRARTEGLEVLSRRIHNLSFLNPLGLLKSALLLRKHGVGTLVFSSSQDMKAAGLAAKIAGVRRIVYLRGLAVPVRGGLLNRFYFNSVLTHLVASSLETRRTLLLNFPSVRIAAKTYVVYHGIEEQDLVTRPDDITPADGPGTTLVLGTAGRLTQQKGQLLLLDVARLLAVQGLSFRLRIAGTGELREAIEQGILQRDLEDRVELCGFVENMIPFLDQTDIFLLGSTWEGFGFVLVEAMARAKPVVAWQLSSNPEIVDHGHTGYLVDYPDVDKFAANVRLLMEDPELRQRMGRNGLERVRSRFTMTTSAQAFCLVLGL
ncbi:MAG: glycosyltransferase family 4 protein [Saprospiraceae bacterium]|nr:glycosyltransferase family 4 protein [Saprospiraceae bacterium]